MMKKSHMLELKDMSDSREVLSERPRRFVMWFVYVLIALIAVALTWMFFGEIDYYVRAHGSVRPNEPISTIRNTSTGRIAELNLEEGRHVTRGELLFSICVEPLLDMESLISEQYNTILTQIANYEKFRESVILERNLFDIDNEAEQDFYFMFESYVTDRALAVEQVEHINMGYSRIAEDANVHRSNAGIARHGFSSDLQAWEHLYISINQNRNLVPRANSIQYGMFIDYEKNMQLHNILITGLEQSVTLANGLVESRKSDVDSIIASQYELEGRRDELETMLDTESVQEELTAIQNALDILQNDLNSAKGLLSLAQIEQAATHSDLEVALINRDRYRNDTMLNVRRNVRALELSISDIDAQTRIAVATRDSFYLMGYDVDLIHDRHRLDVLTSAGNTIFNLQNSLNSIYLELIQLRLKIADASVFSPICGTVNLVTQLNEGDFIQAGMEIGTIVPDVTGNLIVQMAVHNSDIAEIQIGQEVAYRFHALPFQDFGELSGRIIMISSDARQDNLGNSFFLVEGEIIGRSLRSRDGSEEYIRIGMTADVRVITGSERIIFWVLDNLNFLNR